MGKITDLVPRDRAFYKIRITSFGSLALLCYFFLGCAEPEHPLFQRSARETATIKDLPSADVLSVRVSIAREEETWSIAHRAAMLYFSHSKMRMSWPVFLVLPDETDRAEHDWLFLLPDKGGKYPDPDEVAERYSARLFRNLRWSLKRLDALVVGCYRINQRPKIKTLLKATQKLLQEGKKRSWKFVGQPRYAIFANPRITPFFMQAFEVQIPVLER